MLHFPPSNTKAARSAGSSGPSYSLTVEHPAASDVSTSRRPTTAIALATPRVFGRSPRCTCLESINTSIGRPGRRLESRAGQAAALGSVPAAGRDVVLHRGLDGRIALAQLDAVEPRPLALELDRGDGGVREVHGEHDVGWRVTRVAGRVDRRHGRRAGKERIGRQVDGGHPAHEVRTGGGDVDRIAVLRGARVDLRAV